MGAPQQGRLFSAPEGQASDSIWINDRCRVQTEDGYRVVSVSGITLAHYAIGDRMAEAYAAVSLVEQAWARQTEVSRAFGLSDRTIRRYQGRFEAGGLAALGRPVGFPQGRPRTQGAHARKVSKWKAEGLSNREIARRLGVTEKSVRKKLRRLGWGPESGLPAGTPLLGADPNLSGLSVAASLAAPVGLDGGDPAGRIVDRQGEESADPNLSGFEIDDVTGVSLDEDAADRSSDRLLAYLGLLDDAIPIFREGTSIPGVGVLLAIPSLVESGVFEVAREVYASLAPAFYGLRTTMVTLLLMALRRIKRPEQIKEHSPEQLGRLLGLDRAPEVKTLRRKLARLAACRRAAEFGRALAYRRVATRGHAIGFLYVDGHVRVYHGKQKLPKAHVARMRLSMPATTDYWVNDIKGDPLFVVPTEANPGLVKMLPVVLQKVRELVGERRVTIVFDRGGWSPTLFARLIASGCDILTYRKGPFRKIARNRFRPHEESIEGGVVRYVLADQEVLLGRKKPRVRLRQVTRLSEDGHQTPIITSRRDLSAVAVAYRMFERWRQENFFKYLREEYALDVMVDYAVEPADAERLVPNPLHRKMDAELSKARRDLERLQAKYGREVIENREQRRRTMRGFKIANSARGREIRQTMKRVADLAARRARIPIRVPVGKVVEGEVVKLSVERNHLTSLIKMVAYQAESDLVRLLGPDYRRVEEEGRTLIQTVFATSGDIEVADSELIVSISSLSAPHRTQALAAMCKELNETSTKYPGSKLRLRFAVKPAPPQSMAFPGTPLPKSARQG